MPDNDWLELLIAKLPPFDPDWSEELQVRWFGSFLRLLEVGRAVCAPQASAEGDGLAKARGTSDTPESGVDASTPSKEKS